MPWGYAAAAVGGAMLGGGGLGGGGGGGGGGNPANTTTTTIPEYARPTVERMLGKAEALTQTPYQEYQGQRIAGFTPLQEKAFQGVANLGPSVQGQNASQLSTMAGLGSLNAGSNYANQATNPNEVGRYMSPYIQNALNPTMQEAVRQSDMMGQKNAAQAVGSGAFGGSRFGIQEAERQRNLGQNLANIYGTGMQNAYNSGLQSMQFGNQLGLQGYGQAGQLASTLGNLGQQEFQQTRDAAAAQQAAGTQQQQLEQQNLTQQYQDFQNQRQYPYQQLAFMSDMLRGLPLSSYTQTMYQPPANMLSQLGGAAAIGKSFGAFAEGGQIEDDGRSGINNLLANRIGRG